MVIMKKRNNAIPDDYPKIGLALSGGSTWGIAHLGALKALAEHNVPIHCISGTSAGSMVAALYAFGVPLSQMIETTRSMTWKTIASFARSRLGWASNKGIATLMRDTIGDVRIEKAKIPLAIIATNIETGEKEVFRKGNVADIVRASTSLPGYFTPVQIGNALYVDGGLIENLPHSPLKEMGADLTIGIDLLGYSPKYTPRHAGHVLSLAIDIIARERDKFLPDHIDVLVRPNLEKFSARSFSEADQILHEGYDATVRAMPHITEKIAAYQRSRHTFLRKIRRLLWRKVA